MTRTVITMTPRQPFVGFGEMLASSILALSTASTSAMRPSKA